MAITVKWFNHASFRIQGRASVLYIDPWRLPDAPHDADLVFISHSHHDHCSAPDIAAVSKADTALVAPADVIELLHAANAVDIAEQIYVKDVAVEPVAAYNVNKAFHPRAHNWMGAVFTLDGKRIYYAGDTDLVPEMSGLTDVDLALLPVGGTYTLSALEAAKACQAVGCRIAVPYHYGEIVGTADDGLKFAQAVTCCQVRVLRPGESLQLE